MPPVTTALIVANVAIFLIQSAVLPGLALPFALWPIGSGAASGGQVDFQAWQLVTYGFLHGGITHLLFNMFGLYMFGGPFEQVVGPRRFLAYYFVCVVTAGITQLLVSMGAGGVYPTVGASGGVFGLLLAYAAYFPHNRLFLLFIPVPIPARIFVVIYAVAELALGVSGAKTGVAHFAHLGGLVGGAIMLAFWRFGRTPRR